MCKVRRMLLVLIPFVVLACSSASPTTPPPSSIATPAGNPGPTVQTTPIPPPALVGTWLGFHSCQRIVDMMTAAGMPEQALLNAAESGTIPGVSTIEDIADPENPCVGASDKKHWHFFNPDGEFGSLDMNRGKVDFGKWAFVDEDTFTIEGTPFDFKVDGDELRMEPGGVGTCPVNGQWCREAWKLMVAMPGMTWTRDE